MILRIKEAREMAGYSQKELAARIGVAPNTFCGYENGLHDPKSNLLVKIAEACNVSTDFLFGVDTHKNSSDSENDICLLKIQNMSIEDQLKNEILRRYKTVKGFSEHIGVPNSTVNSMFKRGIKNAGIVSMIKIFSALDLDIASVADGSLRKIGVKKCCDDLNGTDCERAESMLDLSMEERAAVMIMRTNSDARAQILLVMEMHKNGTPKE